MNKENQAQIPEMIINVYDDKYTQSLPEVDVLLTLQNVDNLM